MEENNKEVNEMGWNEWIYKRILKRIYKDKKLISWLHERIRKNTKKVKDIENSRTMIMVN